MAEYNLPPDLASEQEALKQQEALASILANRSLAPVQSSNPMSPVSPLQGVAQIIAARRAGQLRNSALQGRRELGEEYNRRMSEGVQDYMRTRFGTGVQPDPQEFEQAADFGTPAPAPARGNPREAMIMALTSRNPVLQGLGAADYKQELEMRKPRVLGKDAKVVFPGSDQPEISNPAPAEKAIPKNWQTFLPPNAKRLPNDPNGVFRMPGASGADDVYAIEFERGLPKGYKRIDADPNLGANGGNGTPYWNLVSTPQGLLAVSARNPRERMFITDEKGNHLMKAPDDPGNRGDVAAATAAGKEQGKLTETTRQRLPSIIEQTNQHLALIDKLVGSEDGKTKPHKGFSSYVGFTLRPGARLIHGTPEAEFENILNQVKGGSFMQAYETLKGGGQITVIEGEKGTQALERMQRATTEKDFVDAARDFQKVLRVGLERAKAQAASSPRAPRNQTLEDLLKKYGGQ